MKNGQAIHTTTMDSSPKQPRNNNRQQRFRKLAGATNQIPIMLEPEEDRITSPPLEIYVNELSVSGSLEASSSAMTDITFENSCSMNLSGLFSLTSSMSSLGGDGINVTTACASGDDEEENQRRLPPRGQSCGRSKRGGRKGGVMRWASMPQKKSPHSRAAATESPPCTCTQNSPRIPRRRGSNDSLNTSDSINSSANRKSEEEHHHQGDCGACKTRQKPKLPIRKGSAASLFDDSFSTTSSSTEEADEVVLSAHAA
ncbi:expressed unknown protein [Seminavis robusta]|uniref:Uncharacterized protein n=1 Tax=Seminavis robusta TaxID=568900 RepID=A0A9N8HRX1_9STRA|nr:expressed unknown protein [Seminavis robusta]|eukprot:Sro1113_g242710.1 n/a (257) ;mRNA; f:29882-30652